MELALADRSSDAQADPAPNVGDDIGPSVGGDGAPDRPLPHVSDGGTIAAEANSFIEDVSITSANEVARLITALEGVRDLLERESHRIQREAGRYFYLNDGAFKAAKMMLKSIPQWRR
jgi:hypothetical protein